MQVLDFFFPEPSLSGPGQAAGNKHQQKTWDRGGTPGRTGRRIGRAGLTLDEQIRETDVNHQHTLLWVFHLTYPFG